MLGFSRHPSRIAKNTLYIHRTRGLGLRCLAIMYPTTLPDTLHRNPFLSNMCSSGLTGFTPRFVFLNVLSLLNRILSVAIHTLNMFWNARSKLRAAVEVASLPRPTAYVTPTPRLLPDCIYMDGNRIGSPPSSGAYAVLLDGRIVVCRIVGNPNS